MTTRNNIRQQNAERRLRHNRWGDEPIVAPSFKLLMYGAATALLVALFFAVR